MSLWLLWSEFSESSFDFVLGLVQRFDRASSKYFNAYASCGYTHKNLIIFFSKVSSFYMELDLFLPKSTTLRQFL